MRSSVGVVEYRMWMKNYKRIFFVFWGFFWKIKALHFQGSIFQFQKIWNFLRKTHCYPCDPGEFPGLEINSQAPPHLTPRKYAANRPILSRAGSTVTTWTPHAEDGRQVCGWGFLTGASSRSIPRWLIRSPLQTQVTPNRCAVIFHWEPQGFRGAAEVQDRHITVPSEPWPLRLPATSSRNLCPLQTLRTLPTSAQQLPATANHLVWD